MSFDIMGRSLNTDLSGVEEYETRMNERIGG
jgi:hypothetical protein